MTPEEHYVACLCALATMLELAGKRLRRRAWLRRGWHDCILVVNQ